MDKRQKGRGKRTSKDAFDRIAEEHGGMLWRTAASYELHPDLRQELYQEILLAVWRAIPRFREDANLRTYLARVAHNRGVTHVNRQVRQPPAVPLDSTLASTSPTPEQELQSHQRRGRLLASIKRMPLASQQVVTLTLEGFTPREIADVLGVSANVVSIRLSRAKQTLRDTTKEDAG